MRRMIFTSLIIVSFLLCTASIVNAEGSGLKAYVPADTLVEAAVLPYAYNGTFVVYNDGQHDGVYVVRVSVDDPAAISWINVTPASFVLSPGESKLVRFDINISPEQAKTGEYHIIFTPTLLPRNVEPYLNTFAQYISVVDRYNLTLVVPSINGFAAQGTETVGSRPVYFFEDPTRVNLIQYSQAYDANQDIVEIDRAIRLNAPANATVGEPVPLSVSVFEGLSNRGIDLIAVSPEGIFYPVTSDNFTFNKAGKWGIIASVGDLMLLGRPVSVSSGNAYLAMPGIDTILASIAFILLLSLVPIWILTRDKHADPYRDITFKTYVIRKYIDHFDTDRLKRAVGQVEDEYYDLVSSDVPGDRDQARASLDELKTLTRLES